jgi:hypothetical protein
LALPTHDGVLDDRLRVDQVLVVQVDITPSVPWVTQQARQLTWTLAGRPESFRFLIRDQDQKFPDSFDEVFRASGLEIIRTPFRAPQANGVAERFVRTVRSECIDWLLILNNQHLERVLDVFVEHYNCHQASSGAGLHAAPPGTSARVAGDGAERGACPASRSSGWCGSRVRPGAMTRLVNPTRSTARSSVMIWLSAPRKPGRSLAHHGSRGRCALFVLAVTRLSRTICGSSGRRGLAETSALWAETVSVLMGSTG